MQGEQIAWEGKLGWSHDMEMLNARTEGPLPQT